MAQSFLYSQDLSNSKTEFQELSEEFTFLYSQDLSNSKTMTTSASYTCRFCTLKI